MPNVSALCGLLLLLTACSPPAEAAFPSPLDVAEVHAGDGWQLRIHGDGSGTLRHRHYPLHHLDYPTQTFDAGGLSRAATRCAAAPCTGYQLSYYSARRDQETRCGCADSTVLNAAMTTAITRMQLTVDDAVSERSCRMLRRAWFAGE